METQMSVYRTSAPAAPSVISSVSVTEPPLSAAYCFASSTSSCAGNSSFGAQAVKCSPIFAQAIMRELPILLRASPK